MLPGPLTSLTAVSSLNKEYLKPHDTIHAIAQGGNNFHGIMEMTWAFPTKTTPAVDGFTFTGSKGWMSVNRISPPSGPAYIRIHTKIAATAEGLVEEEDSIDIPSDGVQAELRSFFGAIQGKDDGLRLGEPKGALFDVAFIQAALNSKGSLIDLERLLVDG